MAFVYILLSEAVPKTYVGSTINLDERVAEHRRLIHSEKFDTLSQARSREKYLKTAAGRKFLKTIIPR